MLSCIVSSIIIDLCFFQIIVNISSSFFFIVINYFLFLFLFLFLCRKKINYRKKSKRKTIDNKYCYTHININTKNIVAYIIFTDVQLDCRHVYIQNKNLYFDKVTINTSLIINFSFSNRTVANLK